MAENPPTGTDLGKIATHSQAILVTLMILAILAVNKRKRDVTSTGERVPD